MWQNENWKLKVAELQLKVAVFQKLKVGKGLQKLAKLLAKAKAKVSKS